MKNVLVTDFSGMLEAEDFLAWMGEVVYKDWRDLEGTHCYCDEAAKKQILAGLPEPLPKLRWIDSGDYHYMSHLLSLKEKEPFHLVLLDHHPDDQEAAFGGVLSCGSWVRAMQEENPLLRDVLEIGPDGCPEAIPEGWLAARRGERVYVSLDEDILCRCFARTDWSQGTHTLEQVLKILGQFLDGTVEVTAIDICGGLTIPKGATPEDLRVNRETNIELYKFITEHLK